MNVHNGRVGLRNDKDINVVDNGTPEYQIFISKANHLLVSLKNEEELLVYKKNSNKKCIAKKFLKISAKV